MQPQTPKKLWTPSESFIQNSNLQAYQNWLASERNLSFNNYDELWEWSINHVSDFWETIAQYYDVIFHKPYSAVLAGRRMPHFEWFPGSKVNYAEHVFRHYNHEHPAILFQQEGGELQTISWIELKTKVAAMTAFLKSKGVRKGDRVVAFMPNIPEATIAFLATCSLGAVWSTCSPDFGASSVIDRFQQIEPKVLIAVDGYRYGGKAFPKAEAVAEIIDQLPTLEAIVEVPYLSDQQTQHDSTLWSDVVKDMEAELLFEPVEFSDPIWVLYSSGTTGQPKAITHSQGGVLLEHLKYVSLHNDVKPGERYFWFTTTGWMMWNFVQATLLCGATIVLYDGSPAYPDLSALWKLAEKTKMAHFGTSAPFIIASMKQGLDPINQFDLSSLRSISSTGSPLPPEGFDWIYQSVKKEIWLCSMSGGTDVCSAFVGGCPTEPVFEGEIQRRALGCSMFSYSDQGYSLTDEVGEMVVTEPMPSMPIYFWNDENKVRYQESYFEMFPGVWRHGDWLQITTRNTLIIKGRSDATLNRHGIRIGTAEIYQSMSAISAIKDSLVVNIELENGEHFMPLFVIMNEGYELNDQIVKEISAQLKSDFTPRHVPDEVIVTPDIPYTISGKKMEAPVKKILMGKSIHEAANLGAMRNPESLAFYETFAARIKQLS